MKKRILCYAALLLLCTSCNKTVDALIEKAITSSATKTTTGSYTQYQIKKGRHSSDHDLYKSVATEELKFVVKFDSTAIYETQTEVNQYDINKLYGFSDNNADHHQYSARFGWSWTENSLHLYAYVYNEGAVVKQEVGTVPLNTETTCSIQVFKDQYKFTVNNTSLSVPRTSTTPEAKGYKLYPYFGGDETAPHDVNIWIKDL